MKHPIRFLLLCLIASFVSVGSGLFAADANAVTTKPGYNVVVDVAFDEQGVAEEAKVVSSDDPTADTILHRVAMVLSREIKQSPRLKDGKPVKFTLRVPFNFPVEDDEGAAAKNAPMPKPIDGQRPAYPENLADAGEVGGAILELNVDREGKITKLTVLRASHPEFARSAEAAVRTWIFGPAMKDGLPVESRCRTVIAYSVNGKEVDWKWRVAPRPSIGGSVVIRPARPVAVTTPAPAAPGGK